MNSLKNLSFNEPFQLGISNITQYHVGYDLMQIAYARIIHNDTITYADDNSLVSVGRYCLSELAF